MLAEQHDEWAEGRRYLTFTEDFDTETLSACNVLEADAWTTSTRMTHFTPIDRTILSRLHRLSAMMPARDGEPTSKPSNTDALAVGNPGSRCPMALPIHCLKDREQVQDGPDIVSWRHPDFEKTVDPGDGR